jgi:branched-chain amino acid aminotransferase
MHPSAHVLHYGTSCFEGMKAFVGADGKGRLFRPELNFKRFATSCARLAIPPFDERELLQCLERLLQLDRAWIPDQPGHYLYVRAVERYLRGDKLLWYPSCKTLSFAPLLICLFSLC